MKPRELYKKYVIEEIKYRKDFYHPVKSNTLLRLLTRKLNPKKLRPNPEDEFSLESIGPNWEIVNKYEESIRLNQDRDIRIFDEPIYVVRLDKGSHMLLNGHHRWLASLALNVKKVPVKVTNITEEKDVYHVINKSKRNKCVSIDLDEVLLANGNKTSENTKLFFPLNKIYAEKIRENTSLLTRELNRMGYDVWVYTGSFLSYNHIKHLLFFNGCKFDGIVNGLKAKGKSGKLKDIFRNKYKTIVHVSNDYISCVDASTKEYEVTDLNVSDKEWAMAVVAALRRHS